MLDWKYFRDEKPSYGQDIIFIPSPQFGLLFAVLTRFLQTDQEGDHFSEMRTFREYRDEMWANINPPKI
jgi:hypothetical protein